jgi:hypothetical protein
VNPREFGEVVKFTGEELKNVAGAVKNARTLGPERLADVPRTSTSGGSRVR